MRRYLRYWREAFRLPSLSPEEVLSTFHVPSGGDLLSETLATGRGVVISLPHMGNWDHAGAWFALEHGRFTTVAERLKPESLYERFLAYRESLGMEVLPLTGGPRVLPILSQRLKAGGLVALLGDRDLTAARHPGGLLRGQGGDAGWAGGAGTVDRGGADPRDAVARGRAHLLRLPPRGRPARRRRPQVAHRRDRAGSGGRVRDRDRRAPRRLAHAPGAVDRRPGPPAALLRRLGRPLGAGAEPEDAAP